MVDPVTLGIASLAVGVIGTGVAAVGAEQSSAATQKAEQYQAQVATNNSIIASQSAEAATQAGQAQATTQSLRARAALGAVTTNIAASGVDVNTGSAAEARESQRELGELDTLTTVQNAALQAYGYRTQQTGFQAQSGLNIATGQNAAVAGNISAATGLLGGASSLGLKWTQLQNAGALTSPTAAAELSGPGP
jgi:hypothetical protein